MILKQLIFSFLLSIFLSASVVAQNNPQFQMAGHLMQQQKYSEALPLLKELNEDNPGIYIYADRLIDCLIQLKQYDEAISLANNYEDDPEVNGQVQIRIGELYHYKDQKEKALEIWQENLNANENQLQLYITTARVMVNRREYLAAVDIYKQARNKFQNNRIFFSDIANAYMQAGEYELAINEWLALLEDSPNQISFIQRSLLRYNDPILYDITIVELNDRLSGISLSNPLYHTFYELQIWLLQENKLYRRAFAVAKEYENRSNSFNYSLFNLGRQLVNNNEFKLAEEAFTYYTDKAFGEIKWRGLEELSNTYSVWAKYIDDYNLDFSDQRDSLYKLAIVMLDSIETETSSYSRMNNVYLKRAELALDHVFDLEKAENSLQKLKSIPGSNESPEIPYLEGRINLAKKEYPQARISFTRANKQAEIGEMAEKTRYFLALTDFYSGDYEFSTIQLKSLGRNNTSYYANDALQLRLWLQEGLSIDTTGTNLSKFADAVFKYRNGESPASVSLFSAMVEDPNFLALKDDALLFYVRSSHVNRTEKYIKLDNYLSTTPYTPIKEKLLWELAKLAERINVGAGTYNCETSEDCFFADSSRSAINSEIFLSAKALYEQLILEFPGGFYAPYARERLTNLTEQKS